MYINLSGKNIILGKTIAKGGEGEVFEIKGNTKDCIKIYHIPLRNKEREEKLKYMCNNQPQPLETENYRICWPNDVIYENGVFIGYVMPKAYDDSILPYHLCQPNIPQNLSSEWRNTYDRNSTSGIISRLKLCTNIVAVISRVLSTGKYVLVDLKPQNVLITRSGKVSLIDMDSVQISVNKKILYKAPVSTPEYTPPEAKVLLKSNVPISQDWDMFSVGVLVYEIMCGIHPYAGTLKPPFENVSTINEKIEKNLTHINKGETSFKMLPPPHQIFNSFSLNFRNIFKRIFDTYTIGSSSRPKMESFGVILYNEVIKYEENIIKIQQKQALKENQLLKTQLSKVESENKSLNKILNDTVISLNDLKQKLNASENSLNNLKIENQTLKSKSTAAGYGGWLAFVLIIGISGGIIGFVNYNDLKTENYSIATEVWDLKNNISQKETQLETESEVKNSDIKSLTNQLSTLKNVIDVNIGPIIIKKVEFKSSRFGETVINYGQNLYKTESYYLYPRILYEGIVSGQYDIKIKYFAINGDLMTSTNGGNEFTLIFKDKEIYDGENYLELGGFGNNTSDSFESGTNKYEIWINNKNVYSDNFYIY